MPLTCTCANAAPRFSRVPGARDPPCGSWAWQYLALWTLHDGLQIWPAVRMQVYVAGIARSVKEGTLESFLTSLCGEATFLISVGAPSQPWRAVCTARQPAG